MEFTGLAAKYKAVNLGQGFPNFAAPSFVKKALAEATMKDPLNQYTRSMVEWHRKQSIFPSLSYCNLGSSSSCQCVGGLFQPIIWKTVGPNGRGRYLNLHGQWVNLESQFLCFNFNFLIVFSNFYFQ